MRMKTSDRIAPSRHADASCSVWCRITRPLFRRLFLKRDRNPAALAAEVGNRHYIVDAEGFLVREPDLHVHDKDMAKEFSQRMINRLALAGFLGLIALGAYLFLLSPHPDMEHLSRSDWKVVSAPVLVLVGVSFHFLVFLAHWLSHRPSGGGAAASTSLLQWLALLAVFSYPMKSGRHYFGWFVAFSAMLMFFLAGWPLIASLPQTPLVHLHMRLMAAEAAAFAVFVALVFLANALFWPCLECHGLREEDFLYSAGK